MKFKPTVEGLENLYSLGSLGPTKGNIGDCEVLINVKGVGRYNVDIIFTSHTFAMDKVAGLLVIVEHEHDKTTHTYTLKVYADLNPAPFTYTHHTKNFKGHVPSMIVATFMGFGILMNGQTFAAYDDD